MSQPIVTQAKVTWFGVVSAIVANSIEIPFLTVDTSPKSSQDVPTVGTLHEDLLNEVNSRVGSANELIGVGVGASLELPKIKIDLTDFMAKDASSDSDLLDIQNEIRGTVKNYANGVILDENNRVSYVGFNAEMFQGQKVEFKGDIQFNEDTSMSLVLASVILTKSDGSTVEKTVVDS